MIGREPLESPFIQHNPHFINEELVLYKGWDETLASQLVAHARDEDMLGSVPLDAKGRFRSIEKADQWHMSKPNVVYSLSRAAELAGVIWFMENRFAGAERTFAMRIYQPFQGRGLGMAFARATHMDHELGGYDGDTWLEVAREDNIARNLFTKLNYQIYDTPGLAPHKLRMIRKGITSRATEIIRTPEI